jgi:hypothetical protein
VSRFPLIAMAYSWSNTGVAYFISTVGNTHAHDEPYRSYFEDPYGGTGTRVVPRPVLADFLYQVLPVIDEHNKQRQYELAIDRKWPTQCCWFKLRTGLLGMSAVNMQRIYKYRFTAYTAARLCASWIDPQTRGAAEAAWMSI